MTQLRHAIGMSMETPYSGCYIQGLSSGDEQFPEADFRSFAHILSEYNVSS